MNGLVLMEFCGKRFMNCSTDDLKKSFYQLMLKNPMSYAQISEYLVEFANRGHYEFIIDYLIEYPLHLERKTSRLVAEVLRDMPHKLLRGYGYHARLMYGLYQGGELENNELSFQDYLLDNKELADKYSMKRRALLQESINF